MIKVKSKDDLTRIALARGGATTVGKDRFNSTRDTGIQRPAPAPPPVVSEKMEQPPAAPVALDLAPLAQAQERVGAILAQAIASIPQPSAPCRWQFKVNRDAKGLITTIDATPIQE